MRNYKQIDVEKEKEERVRKRDIIGAIFAITGTFIFILGMI